MWTVGEQNEALNEVYTRLFEDGCTPGEIGELDGVWGEEVAFLLEHFGCEQVRSLLSGAFYGEPLDLSFVDIHPEFVIECSGERVLLDELANAARDDVMDIHVDAWLAGVPASDIFA